MKQQKYLFIDRDGTLIVEPADQQVDSVEKLVLMSGVIHALYRFKNAGFQFVMVSNQDGLSTNSFPQQHFEQPQQFLIQIFQSQGIHFEAILICPHFAADACECRKPKIGLVIDYLRQQKIERNYSYVIGDRETDLQLANHMGITGIRIGSSMFPDWQSIANHILEKHRIAKIIRNTYETEIIVEVNLDQSGKNKIETQIGFFDHMLEQFAKHAGISLMIKSQGDLHIDDHHTVEDTALALGEAIRQALGNKHGIQRYGFLLPMDEASTQLSLDLSGRPFCIFEGKLDREKVGELSTELIPHFFRSFANGVGANLHIRMQGNNNHHMIESAFKALGRTFRQAINKNGYELPTTKGTL